jgi:hypothetical protein
MNVYEPKTRKKFKSFQIRWAEKLGEPGNPYLIRWTLLFFNFSIILHHWIRSDDIRFFNDNSCDLISIIVKGGYANVTPKGRFEVKAGSVWHAKAAARHYLDIPANGAWTILLCSRPYRKWGFWVTDNRMLRPLAYFHKYGVVNE